MYLFSQELINIHYLRDTLHFGHILHLHLESPHSGRQQLARGGLQPLEGMAEVVADV